MKTRRIIGITGAAAVAIALPLLAAERLAVKTGLWQSALTMTISGLNIPKEELDKMPPAQRAQMEQMLKQMGVGTPRTETSKSCLTEKDLDGNIFGESLEDIGEDCEHKQVVSTAKRQEWTFQCRTPAGAATGRMVVDAVDDSNVRGTMEMRSPQGNMDMKFDARWQAASCAGADLD